MSVPGPCIDLAGLAAWTKVFVPLKVFLSNNYKGVYL